MNWLFFFFNVLLVAVAGWAIFRTHKLYQDYGRNYIQYYLYFLIAVSVFGFIYYCLSDLIVFLLFSHTAPEFKSHFTTLIMLLAYPIRVAVIYFYINTFLAMAEKTFHKKLKILFFFISSLFVPFFAIGYYRMLESEYLKILQISYLYILEWSIFLLMIGLPAATLFWSRAVTGIKRKLILQFSTLYILGYTAYQFCGHFHDSFLASYMALPFLYFTIHVPALTAMAIHSKKLGFPAFLTNSPMEDFKAFFLNHKISAREAEIALLLFEGLTTKEIEEKLFISPKTIKNHIYKLYKKTGVSTRVQFFNKLLQVKERRAENQ